MKDIAQVRRTPSDRLYLCVAGICVAVEGRRCEDFDMLAVSPHNPRGEWRAEMLDAAAKKINAALAAMEGT